MKFLNKSSHNRFFLFIIILLVGFSTNVNGFSPKIANVPIDETVYVQTADITGANTVKILFERTGPEAGWEGVLVTYTVRFNWGFSNETTEVFHKYLTAFEVEAVDYVAGPIFTIDAEVIDIQLDYTIK